MVHAGKILPVTVVIIFLQFSWARVADFDKHAANVSDLMSNQLLLLENACPSNLSVLEAPADLNENQCVFDETIHCTVDEQCKSGSKCCRLNNCHKSCVDLKDMKVTKPEKLREDSYQKMVSQRFGKFLPWKIFPTGTGQLPCTLKCRNSDDCIRWKGGRQTSVYYCVYTMRYPQMCAHCQFAFANSRCPVCPTRP